MYFIYNAILYKLWSQTQIINGPFNYRKFVDKKLLWTSFFFTHTMIIQQETFKIFNLNIVMPNIEQIVILHWIFDCDL